MEINAHNININFVRLKTCYTLIEYCERVTVFVGKDMHGETCTVKLHKSDREFLRPLLKELYEAEREMRDTQP